MCFTCSASGENSVCGSISTLCSRTEDNKITMLCEAAVGLAITFIVLCGTTLGQLNTWVLDGSMEYYASTKETNKSFLEAKAACSRLGGRVALIKTLQAEEVTMKLIQNSGGKFYIDLHSAIKISWGDGSIANQTRLVTLGVESDSKRRCGVILSNASDNGWTWDFVKCSTPSGYICQRNINRSDSTEEIPNTPEVNPRMTNSKSTTGNRSSSDNATTSLPAVESVGFSFDLKSFLLGCLVPLPFLLAAAIKIIWSSCRSPKKISEKNKDSFKAERNSHRNDDINSSAEFTFEPTYENVNGSSTQPVFGNDGYEQPMSSASQEYVEAATYEDYRVENEEESF